MDDEEEPKVPENPMEKMISAAQFDKKFIEQRKIFLWGAVDDRSAKDICLGLEDTLCVILITNQKPSK